MDSIFNAITLISCGVAVSNITLTAAEETCGNTIAATIQLVLSILSTLASIILIIVRWLNKAKKDGKITSDEVEDLFEDVHNELNNKDDKSNNGN